MAGDGEGDHRAPTADEPATARAGTVLRRALIIWGAGHIALGDRRGWLLVLVQPAALAGLAVLAALLIDGTRWMVLFPALMLYLLVWVAQAVDAHRRAVELGARAGGELQVVLLLPVLVTLVTAFWLVGGQGGSAAATLREYVAAWRGGDAQAAAGLFRASPEPAALAATWAVQERVVAERVAQAAETFGPAAGIDPERPFNSLRFEQRQGLATAGEVTVAVEIVRRQRVETMLLGIVPTATQQTVVVEQLGLVRLVSVPSTPPAWLAGVEPPARVWRIEAVDLAGGQAP